MDSSIDMIGVLLFGPQNGRSILNSVRSRGLALVDDWECFKSTVCYYKYILNFELPKHFIILYDCFACCYNVKLVFLKARLFEEHCGLLTQYGLKHMRAFANICNNLVEKAAVEEAFAATCGGKDIGQYASFGVYSV